MINRQLPNYLTDRGLLPRQAMQRAMLRAVRSKRGLVAEILDLDVLDEIALAQHIAELVGATFVKDTRALELDANATVLLTPDEIDEHVALPFHLDPVSKTAQLLLYDVDKSQPARDALEANGLSVELTIAPRTQVLLAIERFHNVKNNPPKPKAAPRAAMNLRGKKIDRRKTSLAQEQTTAHDMNPLAAIMNTPKSLGNEETRVAPSGRGGSILPDMGPGIGEEATRAALSFQDTFESLGLETFGEPQSTLDDHRPHTSPTPRAEDDDPFGVDAIENTQDKLRSTYLPNVPGLRTQSMRVERDDLEPPRKPFVAPEPPREPFSSRDRSRRGVQRPKRGDSEAVSAEFDPWERPRTSSSQARLDDDDYQDDEPMTLAELLTQQTKELDLIEEELEAQRNIIRELVAMVSKVRVIDRNQLVARLKDLRDED